MACSTDAHRRGERMSGRYTGINHWCKLPAGWNGEPRYLQLCMKLGTAARALPCNLWAFGAMQAQDGDLSKWDAQTLAKCLGYRGNAAAMLEALKRFEYVTDGGQIADWDFFYSLKKSYVARAQAAGQASAAKRAKPSPLSDSPQSDPRKGEKDETRVRGDSHAERDVQHDVAADATHTPSFSSVSIPTQARGSLELALTDTERESVATEFELKPDGVIEALRVFNENKACYPKDERSANAFKGWLRTSKVGKKFQHSHSIKDYRGDWEERARRLGPSSKPIDPDAGAPEGWKAYVARHHAGSAVDKPDLRWSQLDATQRSFIDSEMASAGHTMPSDPQNNISR